MIPWTILMKGNHPLKLNIQAPKTALQIIQNYPILQLLEIMEVVMKRTAFSSQGPGFESRYRTYENLSLLP